MEVELKGWTWVIEGFHSTQTVTVRGYDIDGPRMEFPAATAAEQVMSLMLRLNYVAPDGVYDIPAAAANDPTIPAPLEAPQRPAQTSWRPKLILAACVTALALFGFITVERWALPDIDASTTQATTA